MKLMEYFPIFIAALKLQLESDQVRWKDEWKKRPIQGDGTWPHQNVRVITRIDDYYSDWLNNDTPIPWLKVCGNAFIAWVREQSPDTYDK